MADTPLDHVEETLAVTSGPDEDLDEGSMVGQVILSQEAALQRWQARRPIIEHLKEGVAVVESLGPPYKELVPLFDIDDRIVVDVKVAFLAGTPWLHTLVGKVRHIDDESGVVRILDEESHGYRAISFRDGLHDIRLAPAKGNPFLLTAAKPVKIVVPLADGEKKRGRGRPPGSKNRSKEEILAEREAYRKLREAKKRRR